MMRATSIVLTCLLLIGSPIYALAQTYTTRDDIPADSPFQRARPLSTKPAPAYTGPRNAISAPVETVDESDSDIPELNAIQARELPPVAENPTEITKDSGAIFGDEDLTEKVAVIRSLNKVTAKYKDINIPIDEEMNVDGLLIRTVSCRTSEAESHPEYAALLSILEVKRDSDTLNNSEDNQPPSQMVFNGWVFASSPSLNGLEHPVYDVSLLKCVNQQDIQAN